MGRLRALAGGRAEARPGIAEDDFTTYTGARVTVPNFAPAWYYAPGAPMIRAALAGLAAAGLDHGLTKRGGPLGGRHGPAPWSAASTASRAGSRLARKAAKVGGA